MNFRQVVLTSAILTHLSGACLAAPAGPLISSQLTDTLTTDTDTDARPDPGEGLRYNLTITNSGSADATNTSFSMALDANTTFSAGTVIKSTPIAANDSYITDQNTTLTINAPGLLANDFDLPAPTSVRVTSHNSTGMLGVVSGVGIDGSFTYDPAGNLNYLPQSSFEVETFTYTVTDADGNTDTAAVKITVNGLNDTPQAQSTDFTTDEDTTLNTHVTATDADAGTVLTYSLVGSPPSGLNFNSDGTFTYTPPASMQSMSVGDSQDVTFQYRTNDGIANSNTAGITIHVTGVNDAPQFVAGSKETFDTIGNTEVKYAATDAASTPHIFIAGNLKANFTDPDIADTLSMSLVSSSPGASVTVNSDGTFSYIPSTIAGSADAFVYRVSDGHVNVDRTATVFILSKVWYVKNNAPAGGTGRSNSPFSNLASAGTASASNDYIFVYTGDGTSTGQNSGVSLKAGQHLLGEPIGLSIPVSLNGSPSPTVLISSSAATKPVIGNTAAGSSAIGTGAVPAEIAGLSLSGNTNAIDFTLAGSVTGSCSIHQNAFTAAGSEAIDINHGSSGALTLTIQNNTIASTGACIDIAKTAAGNLTLALDNNTNLASSAGDGIRLLAPTGTGVFTVTSLQNNTVSGSTAGQGIFASAVLFDSTPGGSFQTVSGGSTAVGASGAGNGVGSNGMALTNCTGDLSFSDLDIYTDLGTALQASSNAAYSGSAGLQINVGAGQGDNFAASGAALDLNQVTMGGSFDTLASSSSPTSGVSLVSVLGSVVVNTAAGSSITNATGTDFVINGGNATVTYPGTITDSSGQVVNITSCSGGTKTFSGAIGDSAANTGGSISLTNNTGATINLTGGVTLSTGANPAFTATGGGTVNVTGSNNTIAVGSATAVNIANTACGASGVTFKSVTSNGGTATGIILDNAGSGGFTITGGTSTAKGGDGSGGTLANKDDGGSDGSVAVGTAIYMNNTSNITLRRMQINDLKNFGVRGLSVSGFTMQYCTINGLNGDTVTDPEGSLSFGTSNPSGANGLIGGTSSIDNCKIRGALEHNMEFYSQSGTFTLNITNCDVTNNTAASGSDGIQAEMQGTANATITVSNCFFDDNKSQAIQFAANDSSTITGTINANTVQRTSQGNEGLIFSNGSNGKLTLTISNNTITGIGGVAIFVGQTPGNATTSSDLRATITGNNITAPASATNHAMWCAPTSTPGQISKARFLISNNTIVQNSTSGLSRGILVDDPDSGTSPEFHATVIKNSVSVGDNVAGVVPIVVQARQSSIGHFRVGKELAGDSDGNTATFPNGNPGVAGIRVRQQNPASGTPATAVLEQGTSSGAAATVLAANNPASSTEVIGTVTVVPNNNVLLPTDP